MLSAVATESSMAEKPKLLIVDDQAPNLHAMRRLVAHLEVDIVEALSGYEALSAVLEHDFFLILMDVQMPGMNGFEAAELILNNRRTAHVPIIFLTAISKSEKFIIDGYKSGEVDYIYKPVDPKILCGKIAIFKNLWETQSELQIKNTVLRQKEQEILIQKQSLTEAFSQIQTLLNAAGEGIIGIDLQGHISFSNPMACQLLEIDSKTLEGSQILNFLYKTVRNPEAHGSAELSASPRQAGAECESETFQLKDVINDRAKNHIDTIYWKTARDKVFCVEFSANKTYDHSGQCQGAVLMFQDISARKALEDRLVKMANFDALTGIPNRALFDISLYKALQRKKRASSLLALLFIDLDDFKIVNDKRGHEVGDALLQEVAQRIVKVTREGDLPARVGGDEFAVILYDLKNPENANLVAKEIIAELSRDFVIAGETMNIGASIGIAVHGQGNTDKEALLKAADTAMYAAKAAGKNNWRVHPVLKAHQRAEPICRRDPLRAAL